MLLNLWQSFWCHLLLLFLFQLLIMLIVDLYFVLKFKHILVIQKQC